MKLGALRVALAASLLAATAAAFAACSLTTSLGDLSSGGPADTVRPDGAAPDGTADGVAPGTDGGSDAPGEAAPATPFCDTIVPKPKLCDDFERNDTQGPWEDSHASGASLAIEPSTRGTGRELHATMPLLQGSTNAHARVQRDFGDADEVHLSFALRVDAAPVGSNGVQVMGISTVPTSGNGDTADTYVFVRTDGIYFAEQTFPGGGGSGGSFDQHVLSEPIPFATWTRVDVVLTLAPAPHAKVSVGGKVAYEGAPDPFFRRGAVAVGAGITYAFAPGGPISVHVDDVYVDTK